MGGDPGTGEEDLYCGLGEMHIHLLLDTLPKDRTTWNTAAIRLCRNHEPMIRTEYVHNTHYENLPQPDETPHFENLSLDIYRILWYTKIVIDSMHAFLLGGVGRLAYVRRDPPVHVC